MKKLLLCVWVFLSIGVCMAEAKPKIAILATGGTIAGSIDSAVATTGYTAGVVGVDVLIKAVPQIQDLANISGEQVANIDSSNMRDEIWLKLAKKINKLFDEGVDGVVITHGTDTMEETAYFLNLTIKSDKPVVLVGAMRPSTAISADGPKNLYNAVALAADKEAKNKGVMVAMNDKILSARGVVKTHSLNVDAFSSPDFGDLGYIVDGKVFFYNNISKAHTKNSPFDVSKLTSLPKVDILYTYSNDGSAIAAKALFEGQGSLENMPTSKVEANISILDAIITARMAPSKGQARTLINQGGITLNDEKVADVNYVLSDDDFKDGYAILRKGKKVYHKLTK